MKNRIRAIYVAKEIPISKIKGALPFNEVSTSKETAVYAVDGTDIYLYSFGSIVLTNCSADMEKTIIHSLAKLGLSMKDKMISDDYDIVQDHKIRKFIVTDDCVLLNRFDPKIVKVVARVLAQSVALESYEEEFENIDKQFMMLNQDLAKDGKLNLSEKQIMMMIAKNNAVIEEVVSGIGILEKPSSAWESHLIDSLHTRLIDEFEIRERFQDLHYRMEFVQDNYKIFLESFRESYSARLEWIVIILILLEVVLFVYEIFK